MQKLLIISLNLPYPLSNGGAVAQYYFLEKMRKEYEITILIRVDREYQKKIFLELRQNLPELKLLMFDAIPIKNQTNYINRILNKIYKKLHLYPIIQETKKSSFDTFSFFNLVDPDFANFVVCALEKTNYDLVQLEFFDTLNLLPLIPKEVCKIFVHHEIGYKRLNKILNLKDVYDRYIIENFKSYEEAMLSYADRIIVFNNEDKKILSSLHKKVIVSPFGIPDELIQKMDYSKVFNKFVFLGKELHYPNKQGLQWFLDTIYIPNYDTFDFPILISGEWSVEFMRNYSSYSKIKFTGFISDISTIYENSIMITPILSGSGIRTKILQAFANKIPVISTPFAAEGLYNHLSDEHIIFFEDNFDFIKKYKEIVTDNEAMTEIAKKGNIYYHDNFDTSKLVNIRKSAYHN